MAGETGAGTPGTGTAVPTSVQSEQVNTAPGKLLKFGALTRKPEPLDSALV